MEAEPSERELECPDDGMMETVGLPLGTVTFLLADVEGSTAAWEHAPGAMAEALPWSLAMIESVVAAHGGHIPIERGEGDSRLAAFERAGEALAAALELQQTLLARSASDELKLRVRSALHAGDARMRDERTYAGLVVHRAARLRELARGGQVLVSRAVHDLVADDLPAGVNIVDLGSHRLRDLSRPEQVFLLRHPDLPEIEGGLRSLDAVPHNLPTHLSSFVGRVAELAEIERLVCEHRLVTLTGPGGCGKSRLAVEAAGDAARDRPGGVWLVELSPLSDPDLVPDAVRTTLDLGEASGQVVTDQLVAYLRERRAMLVLDTCEHLVEAAALLVHDLLSGCPQLSILTTSREPLGVAGEFTWRVPPLSVQGTTGNDPSDAVTLFVERARAVRLNFVLDEHARAAVSDICQRLDGIPLAIELAAARVGTLSLDRIVTGLDDRFRLLSGGSRTSLARQRTLQASVEWSHDLLEDQERVVFARLSVFAGSFDLETVTQIVAFDGVDAVSVFDLLSRLVDKSLVQIEEHPDGELRYSLLDTMRHFAFDRLIEAGEVEVLRDRHLTWIMAVTKAAEKGLYREDQKVLAHLEACIDDIRMALEWGSTQPGRGDKALAVAAGLPLWWSFNGRAREGHSWCDRALAAAEAPAAGLLRQAHWALSWLSWHGGDPRTSLAEAATASEEAATAGDATLEARSLVLQGVTIGAVDPPAAQQVLTRAAEAAEGGGDDWTIGAVLNSSALNCLRQDNWEEAEHHLARLRLEFHADPAWMEAMLAFIKCDFQAAVNAAKEGCEEAHRLGEHLGHSVATLVLVSSLANLGQLSDAESAVREAEADRDRGSGPFSNELARLARAVVSLWADDTRAVIAILEPVRQVMKGRGVVVVAELVSLFLACAYRRSGDIDSAIIEAKEAFALGRRSGSRRQQAAALLEQAHLAVWAGEAKRAEDLAHDALSAAAQIRSSLWMTAALEQLGILAVTGESWIESVHILAAVESSRAAMGTVRGPFDSDTRPAREGARQRLGDGPFSVAWAEGEALGLEDAAAYARRARGERGRPSTGWGSLTPTEHKVVELVAEGLTNPQIGERLFIGRGTVKTHLAHIFNKLGVTTRAGLAAQASQRR